MNLKKINFNKAIFLVPSLLAGVLVSGLVFAQETWIGPTNTPPNDNQDKPINIGEGQQTKLGTLILGKEDLASAGKSVFGALTIQGTSVLYFGSSEHKVGLRASQNPITTSSFVLTLPETAGAAGNVLMTSGEDGYIVSGNSDTPAVANLSWVDPNNLNIRDADWQYNLIADNGIYNSANIDSIYSMPAIRVGVGNTSPQAQLDIKAFAGNKALNITSDANANPFNINNINNLPIFTVTATGTLATGTIPWARLVEVPTSSCNIGQVITRFDGTTFTCGTVTIGLDQLDGGQVNQTLRYNGANWEATSFLYNTGNWIGVNTQTRNSSNFILEVNGSVGPTANNQFNLGSTSYGWKNIYAQNGIFDGKLHVGTGAQFATPFVAEFTGDVGPTADNTYDLGSEALRWKGLYVKDITADNATVTGTLSLTAMRDGSVLFIGDNKKVSEDNTNFYWNNTPDTGKRLGLNLGMNDQIPYRPQVTLDVGGSIAMPFTDLSGATDIYDKASTKGVLYLNDSGAYYPFLHTTGNFDQFNIFLGFTESYFNFTTQGSNNIGIGGTNLSANSGDYNIAIGMYNLNSNATGTASVAIGFNALPANTIGSYNSAFGGDALYVNTEGANNIAIGYQSMYGNVLTNNNIAIGREALPNLTAVINNSSNDANNVGIGYTAGFNVGSLENSVYIGKGAGFAFPGSNNIAIGLNSGSQADDNDQQYSNNTYVGTEAGEGIPGNNNVMIGYKAYIPDQTSLNSVFIVNNNVSTNFTQPLVFGKFFTGGGMTPSLRINGAIAAVDRTAGSSRTPTSSYDFMQGGVYGDNYHAFSATRYYRGKTMDSTASCSFNGNTYDWLFFKEGLLICKLTNSTDCSGTSPTLVMCCGQNNENCPD